MPRGRSARNDTSNLIEIGSNWVLPIRTLTGCLISSEFPGYGLACSGAVHLNEPIRPFQSSRSE